VLTLRYHLVSLVAVFLALALGVALGSTSVSQRLLSVVAGDRDSLTKQIDQLSAQRGDLEASQRAANSFAASVSPTCSNQPPCSQSEHRLEENFNLGAPPLPTFHTGRGGRINQGEFQIL